MTLRQKLSQLLIVGFGESTLKCDADIYQCIEKNGIGGVILFNKVMHSEGLCKNIINKEQLQSLNIQLRQLCRNSIGIEPLISIDFEGGAVNRLRDIQEGNAALSAKEMANLSPEAFAKHITTMAALLQELGFNLNFAPVVDLELMPNKGIIGPLDRSFGTEPDRVSDIAIHFAEIFSQHGIGSCFKHFPGHGSAADDSHLGCVDVTDHYQSSELFPYAQLHKIPELPIAVMTAHVVNRHLDASGVPASLSYPVLHTLLRKELSYQGVVISDDLQMRAISEYYSMQESMVQAINAGCDMLIIANQLDYHTPERLIDWLEEAVLEKSLSLQRIEESLRRIQEFKAQLMR